MSIWKDQGPAKKDAAPPPSEPVTSTFRDAPAAADFSPAVTAPPGTRAEVLLTLDEVAVLPASHPLARQRRLQLEDFAGEYFVSLSADDPYRRLIDARFAEAGVARTLRMETHSAAAVCAMVQQGLGVSIVNPLTALAMSSPKLKVRPLTNAIAFHVGILLPQIAAPHPLRSALVDAIAKAASDMERELTTGVS